MTAPETRTAATRTPADAIAAGRVALGIELGSTRIKACLVDADAPSTVLATGGYEWENQLVDGVWTYDLADVEHLQADILDLPVLTERFDLIESFGVLHHMGDPAAGLRVLAGLLKPGGLAFLGLYSELGRRGVVEARAHIAARGYPATPDGVRALRHDLMTGPRRPGLETVLSPASDFWTTSDCRDLLFHVNEHRFTLLEVGQLLAAAGLDFLGLQFGHAADRTRFLAEHPAPGAIQDLEALHRHEQEHPEVFGDTYRIRAQRPRHRRRR